MRDSKLDKIIKKVWQEEIQDIFQKGYLSYERQLQSDLYRLLFEPLLESDFHIWIEPRLNINKDVLSNLNNPLTSELLEWKEIIPDVIISNEKNHEIVGVIEIKWDPYKKISYKKDLIKLEYFECAKNMNKRIELGKIPNMNSDNVKNNILKSYSVSKDVLLYFAFMASINSYAFDERNLEARESENLFDLRKNKTFLRAGMIEDGRANFDFHNY